jgi:hypothetical protein
MDITDDSGSKDVRNGYHGSRFLKLGQIVYYILLLFLYLIVYELSIYFYFILNYSNSKILFSGISIIFF